MSPLPRPGRKAISLCVPLLGIALLLAAATLPASAQDTNATTGGDTPAGAGGSNPIPADAPQPAQGKITRILTMGVVEEGTCADGQAAPCWDVSTLAANPGDVVVLVADLRNSDNLHNLHASEQSPTTKDSPGPKTQAAPAGLHSVAIVMPESGKIGFICDIHPQNMIGSVVTPAAAAAAGGGHASIPALGVHFLAYWVGVIAFAILFIVYGATFLLFKYNETAATTDHWDRAEPEGGSRRLAAVAPILAAVIAIAAIAAIIFVASR